MSAAERILSVRITGLVQGVGFRAFVAEVARRQGVRGWVRNRRDGDVEALFMGPIDRVGEVIVACRHGPPGAQMHAVETSEADETALDRAAGARPFAILPTV